MLEKVTYTNHIGEQIEIGQNGIYINYNDLHDYLWAYQSENDKISLFERGIVKKTIPLIICCSSEAEGIAIKNQLMEYAEKDILSKEAGKLVVGDYYLKCYIIGSTKKNYLVKKGYMEASLEVITDSPAWIKTTTKKFTPTAQTSGSTSLDFAYDMPYDFTSSLRNKTLDNTSFTGVDFVMTIYGACTNPAIYISGHTYQVNMILQTHEYIKIDSKNKTITKYNNNGEESNAFKYRNRNSYIFEKIPSGNNLVTWADDFEFEVMLMEERSEPKWT